MSPKLSDLPTFSLEELLRGLRTKSFSSFLSDGPHSDNGNLLVLSPRRGGSGQKQMSKASLLGSRKKRESPPGPTPGTSVQGVDAEFPGMELP